MQIKIIVPSYVLPELCKFVCKSKKYLPEIGISYSESRDQRFRHTVYDPDGHVFFTRMVHNVQDVKIIVPDDNKWRLIVSYFDDLAFVSDKSKELELQGEHGINYRTCDVCGHWCKNSYVIRNIETGEELQVGRECAKKFGLNQIKHIYSFTRDLYKILDNRFTFDSPEDDGERIWRGGEDSTAVASITKTVLINATKKYYDEHQCWRKATDDGLGSSHDIQAIIATIKDDGSNEYIDAVCKYTLENQSGYSDFSEEMIRVAKDFYVTPRDCCYAFLMIKNYEKYLLEISKGAPLLKSGDYVHVQGEVTEIKYVESYYGQSPVCTIVGNLGNTFKRYGVVPYDNVSDGDKTKNTTEFYAFVKSSNNGVYYLDRVHKNPKKGYNVIHV